MTANLFSAPHGNRLYRICISFSCIVLSLSMGLYPAYLHAKMKLAAASFSKMTPETGFTDGWHPSAFKKIKTQTDYALIRDKDRTVVMAKSNASASALVREITIDPFDFPVITWDWKISNIIEKADASTKKGDDYPARLYISFEYDQQTISFFDKVKNSTIAALYGKKPPDAVLSYVWVSQTPSAPVFTNPYTNRVKMVAVQSGSRHVGKWMKEKRNILEDFKKAFGKIPHKIKGIALMTDTDNTGESATAFYGDIVFTSE